VPTVSEYPILKIWLAEYDKLKAEQTQCIGFCDNLLYVTLGLFGVIIPTAISNPTNYHALLVIPWICLILGWRYLINDEKISAMYGCTIYREKPVSYNQRNRQPA
jgi:hypothetical protein